MRVRGAVQFDVHRVLGRILLGCAVAFVGCGGDPSVSALPDDPVPTDPEDPVDPDPTPAPLVSSEPDVLIPVELPDPEKDPSAIQWCDPVEGSTIEMIVLPPGDFEMGCPPDRMGCLKNEYPSHHVTRSVEICLGWTEVTHAQWSARLPDDASVFTDCGPDCPVESMLFTEAVAFANAESEATGLEPCYRLIGCEGAPGTHMECERVEVTAESGSVLDCEGFRLPTEAEWEHAAGAGEDTLYAGSDDLDEVGWFIENTGFGPMPVGQKEPNALGLQDMSGNVWEWTWDCWQYQYDDGPAVDPIGSDCQGERSSRGGGWADTADSHRITGRSGDPLWHGDDNLGIRLARTRR